MLEAVAQQQPVGKSGQRVVVGQAVDAILQDLRSVMSRTMAVNWFPRTHHDLRHGELQREDRPSLRRPVSCGGCPAAVASILRRPRFRDLVFIPQLDGDL
jgi:hypothetical protein